MSQDPAVPALPHELEKEAINALPIRAYEGTVHQVDNDREVHAAVKHLRRSHVLGFDTETRPAFQRGVSYRPALLQLASSEAVWLFHLPLLAYPNDLWELLSDAGVIKTGVSLGYDIKQLQLLSPFEPAGFVDLVTLSAPLGYKAAGLRNLAGNLLGFRISKGPKTSNWERLPLSQAQVTYAATDAWVGRELFLALSARADRIRGD